MAQNTMDAALIGSSYKAEIKTMPFTSDETVNLPFTGELQEGVADAATVAVTVNQPLAMVEIDELGQETTVNLTVTTNMQKGAQLWIKMTTGATPYDLILGTSTDASTVLGVASSVKWLYLVYNGTTYELISENLIGSVAGSIQTDALTASGAQAVTVTSMTTIIDGVTTEAAGNRTLNLTVNATGATQIPAGAILLVKSKSAAAQTLTFGTEITAAVITGVTGKTMTQSFVFDGTTFYPSGTYSQID